MAETIQPTKAIVVTLKLSLHLKGHQLRIQPIGKRKGEKRTQQRIVPNFSSQDHKRALKLAACRPPQ